MISQQSTWVLEAIVKSFDAYRNRENMQNHPSPIYHTPNTAHPTPHTAHPLDERSSINYFWASSHTILKTKSLIRSPIDQHTCVCIFHVLSSFWKNAYSIFGKPVNGSEYGSRNNTKRDYQGHRFDDNNKIVWTIQRKILQDEIST